VCEPDENGFATGDAQLVQSPPSKRHSKLDPASDETNANESDEPPDDAGADVIVVSGGVSGHGTAAAAASGASRYTAPARETT
jgi:hypothetical protein